MIKKTIICIAASALLWGCGGGHTPAAREETKNVPDQALEKFTITEKKEGKLNWTLEADSAQVMEKEKKVLLQAPKILFYQQGEYSSTLTAERGRVDTGTNDLWGEGKCLLDTAKGEHLETTNLYYNSAKQRIITEDDVKLVRRNEVVYGTGMEATPDLEMIRIRKQRVELKNASAITTDK